MKRLLLPIILASAILLFCLSTFAAENTIYVSSSGDDTSLGTAESPMKSLYAAFRALPYGGKIVILGAMEIESTEFPTSKGLITITSEDGTTDYRNTNNASLTLTGNVYLKSAVKFEKLDIISNGSDINFICNGEYTCFGEELSITKASSSVNYPGITVGATGLVAADGGFVEIHSGNYHRIRNGARGVNSAPHSGDTTLVIYGGTFNDTVYACGNSDFNGNSCIYIYDGTFQKGITCAAGNTVYGNIYISVYGGSFSSDSYLRPASTGTLDGDCTINIFGSDIKKIYNVDSGSITGSVTVNLSSNIVLTGNPFGSTVVSDTFVLETETADAQSISDAKEEAFPEYTENPLATRKTTFKGISDKATYFVKETAGGDLSGDGIVTLIDTLQSLKALVSDKYNSSADIDEDKKLSVYETLLILKSALDGGDTITQYSVSNDISNRLTRYGDAVVTDNKLSTGYIFGTTSAAAYSIYSKATLDENAIVGIYFGCSSASPTAANGYYFEANTVDGTLTVYRIENSNYRIIAERSFSAMSDEAVIKVTCGATAENSVQFYFNDNPLVTEHFLDFDLSLDSKGTGVGLYVENATATLPVVTVETSSTETATYQNYLLSSFTDPEIYYEDGTYYIYGTASGGLSGVHCYTTTDFVTFTNLGIVFDYEDGFGNKSITAANIIEYDGIYYMFYLQESNSLGYSATGYATASSPAGPFTDSRKTPLTSETDLIGGQPFLDDDGKMYLIYTRTTGGNRTYISELTLSDSVAELDLSTETLLLTPSADWEYAKASVLECGFIVKHEGTYYLIYAGGNYNSTYGVGYATADNIYGPYEKYERNPIMWSNDQAFGNGAASVFVSPDASEHFIIYLRNNSPTTTRPLNTCIDRIRFAPNPLGGADILEIAGATVTPQALPSGVGNAKDFDYQMLRWHW